MNAQGHCLSTGSGFPSKNAHQALMRVREYLGCTSGHALHSHGLHKGVWIDSSDIVKTFGFKLRCLNCLLQCLYSFIRQNYPPWVRTTLVNAVRSGFSQHTKASPRANFLNAIVTANI